MNIHEFSTKYKIKKLKTSDIKNIFTLCIGNPVYYEYCPPLVSKESIKEDLLALPPKKTYEDKYYIGFYDNGFLVAVMDFIDKYPNETTGFIGFFMVNNSISRKGIGTAIITELKEYLKFLGYQNIRLGYAMGNEQSRSFWKKNGFIETGIVTHNGLYNVVVMENKLV